MAVPLYLKIYENHRGKPMPGVMALELEMLRHGVSRTQVQAARQVFLRSAEQSGFFESGTTHLVLPKRDRLPGCGGRHPGNGGPVLCIPEGHRGNPRAGALGSGVDRTGVR